MKLVSSSKPPTLGGRVHKLLLCQPFLFTFHALFGYCRSHFAVCASCFLFGDERNWLPERRSLACGSPATHFQLAHTWSHTSHTSIHINRGRRNSTDIPRRTRPGARRHSVDCSSSAKCVKSVYAIKCDRKCVFSEIVHMFFVHMLSHNIQHTALYLYVA